jgi:hypothetical protein
MSNAKFSVNKLFVLTATIILVTLPLLALAADKLVDVKI